MESLMQFCLAYCPKFWIPDFIEYYVHSSKVGTWISEWFLAKKLFFKNNFTRINNCKFIHHRSHLKTFLSYLPCIVRREYLSIIFHVKKCAFYFIKYSSFNKFIYLSRVHTPLSPSSLFQKWSNLGRYDNNIVIEVEPIKDTFFNKDLHS
jgi:hypothetical protein